MLKIVKEAQAKFAKIEEDNKRLSDEVARLDKVNYDLRAEYNVMDSSNKDCKAIAEREQKEKEEMKQNITKLFMEKRVPYLKVSPDEIEWFFNAFGFALPVEHLIKLFEDFVPLRDKIRPMFVANKDWHRKAGLARMELAESFLKRGDLDTFDKIKFCFERFFGKECLDALIKYVGINQETILTIVWFTSPSCGAEYSKAFYLYVRDQPYWGRMYHLRAIKSNYHMINFIGNITNEEITTYLSEIPDNVIRNSCINTPHAAFENYKTMAYFAKHNPATWRTFEWSDMFVMLGSILYGSYISLQIKHDIATSNSLRVRAVIAGLFDLFKKCEKPTNFLDLFELLQKNKAEFYQTEIHEEEEKEPKQYLLRFEEVVLGKVTEPLSLRPYYVDITLDDSVKPREKKPCNEEDH